MSHALAIAVDAYNPSEEQASLVQGYTYRIVGDRFVLYKNGFRVFPPVRQMIDKLVAVIKGEEMPLAKPVSAFRFDTERHVENGALTVIRHDVQPVFDPITKQPVFKNAEPVFEPVVHERVFTIWSRGA